MIMTLTASVRHPGGLILVPGGPTLGVAQAIEGTIAIVTGLEGVDETTVTIDDQTDEMMIVAEVEMMIGEMMIVAEVEVTIVAEGGIEMMVALATKRKQDGAMKTRKKRRPQIGSQIWLAVRQATRCHRQLPWRVLVVDSVHLHHLGQD